jgi:hypothetical protein
MDDMAAGGFGRYFVDLHSTSEGERLVGRLAKYGFATFDGVGSRSSLLRLAWPFVDIVRHRDSDVDGITVIAGRDEESGPGFAGFGRGELLPHTEGSSLPHPPSVLLLACVAPADAGGETFVVDGQALYRTLAIEEPESLRALMAPRSAYFGDGTGHLGSVFEDLEPGRVALRLRLDELSRFSPDAAHALSKLRELIDRFQVTFRMNAGQGYAVQNGRWLHGRRAFSGHREMLRILGHPLPGNSIRYGFVPHC